MSVHYDELETRSHEERERALFAALPDFLARAKRAAPGWGARLSQIDPESVTSRSALAQIPVLRKPELMQAQQAEPPFGGFVDRSRLDGTRLFMSPGPVWEPQGTGDDPWHGGRAFFAAGIRAGDVVHAAISYHMTPGGFILDSGARAVGARVFPAGVGNTDQQVEAAAYLKPDAYAGTPDFLKILLDRAEEAGKDLSSITRAFVSGGALFPSMRADYLERGVTVMQGYATADLGVIAYESMHEGEVLPGMVCSEGMILEIVTPGTDEPVAEGEVGEIVVTSFNDTYPLIRFGTGDLSALIGEPSPCGRTNLRIKGWMGRADQRTKVKGMFVDPAQVAAIVKSVSGVAKARLVVLREGEQDAMKLQVVPAEASPEPAELEAALLAATNLKGRAEIVSELPNDGKVIDDQRDYSQ